MTSAVLKILKEKKHYSTIIHGCMNAHQGRPEYRSFLILVDSGFSSTIFNRLMTKKLRNNYTPGNSTKWSTQAGNLRLGNKANPD